MKIMTNDPFFPDQQCHKFTPELRSLLNKLSLTGYQLVPLENERLGVRVPQGKRYLPPALAEAIRKHKTALLESLLPNCPEPGHQEFWQHPAGCWICLTCYPVPDERIVEVVRLSELPC